MWGLLIAGLGVAFLVLSLGELPDVTDVWVKLPPQPSRTLGNV